MTDRIEDMFSGLRKSGKKALIPFITCGDPDLDVTRRLILAMERSGANLIELGIPFSDPVAEGPVIQKADARALSGGVKIDEIFDMVRGVRSETGVPLVFMMYANCVFHYGTERFFRTCAETGIDGVILPDVPYEEKNDFLPTARKYGVKFISLVAPTSRDRIKTIASDAEGFLYCVSSLGVTGVRNSFDTDFASFFNVIDRYASVPTALGFGISTPEQVKKLKVYADGLIVGSAIVKVIDCAKSPQEAVKNVSDFVGSLRAALDA